eukprot:TRINITY_DN2318_c0_g1_i6.p1 TRINITY_DN2318_c0_g1~~TRINITY_DN2318_c0_g1_i6.p1  ORF type:complete len:101 (-),score=37.91 TRINITY_DN2318_c0_g1_i6:152-454(-)
MYKEGEPHLDIMSSDMLEEMLQEAKNAVESVCAPSKGQRGTKGDYQTTIAKNVKVEMEKKYGGTWHCIVGKNFGADIKHEAFNLAYMKRGQDFILLWKAG